MISEAQHEREREIAERLKARRPMQTRFAGRCVCGASWQPGAIVFLPSFGRVKAICFDCGIRNAEARK